MPWVSDKLFRLFDGSTFLLQVVIMKHLVRVVSIVKRIWSVIKLFYHRFVRVMHIITIIHQCGNVEVFQVRYAIERLRNVWIMLNVEMEHVNVPISLYLMKIKSAVRIEKNFSLLDVLVFHEFSRSMSSTNTKSPTNSLSRQLSTIYRLSTEVRWMIIQFNS